MSKYPEQGESSSRVNIIDLSPPTHTYTKEKRKEMFVQENKHIALICIYVCMSHQSLQLLEEDEEEEEGRKGNSK